MTEAALRAYQDRLRRAQVDSSQVEMCMRCGHAWLRRVERQPKRCPRCKSPYWSKPVSRPTVSAARKKANK